MIFDPKYIKKEKIAPIGAPPPEDAEPETFYQMIQDSYKPQLLFSKLQEQQCTPSNLHLCYYIHYQWTSAHVCPDLDSALICIRML